jgi:tRNA A-37 threonylcarbamoyl transferase component Bud32
MSNIIEKLQTYKIDELQEFALKLDIEKKKSKKELISEIAECLEEYEKYKLKSNKKYRRITQLGNSGKDGTTYLVQTKDGKEYAMKTFKDTKDHNLIKVEINFQSLASEQGIAPEVIDYDTVLNYIVMEKMDYHLKELLKKQKGKLTKHQQLEIVNIYKKLDKIGIFHGDTNILNYMVKDDKIYIIDFGLSKEITPELVKKFGTKTPNIHVMMLLFINKLRDLGYRENSYKYLLPYLEEKDRIRYEI